MKGEVSRRALIRLVASALLSLPALRRAPAQQPSDRGIGGTGYAPGDDRGIGGTGVIGTIQKFGSIVVNDLRIAYAPDADVTIDGRPATPSALRVGQVVRVAAAGTDGSFSTRAIAVTSEVVGPVERLSGRQMVVLGQTVSTAALKVPKVRPGDVVAVSGLRRNDGTIVASLVEARPGAPSRVAGPVDVAPDGSLVIGKLPLQGLSSDLVGRRALVEGRATGDGFVVSRGVAESALLEGVRALSLESYVERRGDAVTLGSGYAVSGAETLGFAAGRSQRAVLTATVGADGRLSVDSVRTGGRTYGEPAVGGRGGGAGGRQGGAGGPGGGGERVPMDFGHGGRGQGGVGSGGGGSGGGGPGSGGPGSSGPGGFGGGGPGGGGGFGGPGGFGGGGGGFGGGRR